MFKLDLHKDVEKDLEQLPDNVYDEVYDMLRNLSIDPYKYTQELDDIFGIDLRSYRKTYVADMKYRIVSKIIDNKVQIVQIIAIGKRDDLEVYKEAFRRLQS